MKNLFKFAVIFFALVSILGRLISAISILPPNVGFVIFPVAEIFVFKFMFELANPGIDVVIELGVIIDRSSFGFV